MVISTLEMARAQDALEATLVDVDQAALQAPPRPLS